MDSMINNVINVVVIAGCFYLFDLLWRGSKLYEKLISKKSINNVGMKLIMIVISIIMIVIALNTDRISTGIFASDTVKVIIQAICLIILYIMTSFIFMDKFTKTKKTSNAK